MFANRLEAGNLLYKELLHYKDQKDAVVISIPRGGVPIGYTLAKKLNLPLEVVLSKKIGHPANKEYAIGAVTLKDRILGQMSYGVDEEYIEEETNQIRALLTHRYQQYYGTNKPLDLKDKTVILVDDGVATGNTLISSIELIDKQQPAEIIVALPVASKMALDKLEDIEIIKNPICLFAPDNFRAVGQFYRDFPQVSDNEVVNLLKKANKNYLKQKHI